MTATIFLALSFFFTAGYVWLIFPSIFSATLQHRDPRTYQKAVALYVLLLSILATSIVLPQLSAGSEVPNVIPGFFKNSSEIVPEYLNFLPPKFHVAWISRVPVYDFIFLAVLAVILAVPLVYAALRPRFRREPPKIHEISETTKLMEPPYVVRNLALRDQLQEDFRLRNFFYKGSDLENAEKNFWYFSERWLCLSPVITLSLLLLGGPSFSTLNSLDEGSFASRCELSGCLPDPTYETVTFIFSVLVVAFFWLGFVNVLTASYPHSILPAVYFLGHLAVLTCLVLRIFYWPEFLESKRTCNSEISLDKNFADKCIALIGESNPWLSKNRVPFLMIAIYGIVYTLPFYTRVTGHPSWFALRPPKSLFRQRLAYLTILWGFLSALLIVGCWLAVMFQ
jgi:hypothetical protein